MREKNSRLVSLLFKKQPRSADVVVVELILPTPHIKKRNKILEKLKKFIEEI